MARPIREIAQEIIQDWKQPYFGAVPYIQAMRSLDGPRDIYGAEDAESIVVYFLVNASNWRGDVARRVKTELKLLIKRS